MFEFGRHSTPWDERATWPDAECIRCGEAAPVDELGYCGRCRRAVRTEVDAGFGALREYLGVWALFADWCAQRRQRIT